MKRMSYNEALELSEKLKKEVENDYIIVRPDTKKKYGYAIRMTGDPQIEISKFEKSKNNCSGGGTFTHNKINYYKRESFQFPTSILNDFCDKLKELQNKEVGIGE